MKQLGIYLTDASFDKKTKVSSISFIEKNTNIINNIQSRDFSNIFLAEYEGIRISVINAFKKFNNIVVVCDNIKAIEKANRVLKREMNLDRRFNSVQFLWLPRDYLAEADFLTKNVDITKNKNLKLDSVLNGSVFDTFVSKEDINDLLLENVLEFNKKNKDLDFSKLKIINIILSGKLIDPTSESESIESDIRYIISQNPREGKEGSNLRKIIELLYLL